MDDTARPGTGSFRRLLRNVRVESDKIAELRTKNKRLKVKLSESRALLGECRAEVLEISNALFELQKRIDVMRTKLTAKLEEEK